VRQGATALALQKWAPLFYPEKGDEEYGEVVIHPLCHRLLKAAGRTSPGLPIKSHSFGLNPGYEEEHGLFSLEYWRYGVLE
jgi:hypothetical protein